MKERNRGIEDMPRGLLLYVGGWILVLGIRGHLSRA